jgi:3-oxoadipate enol-lactonase
VIEPIVVTASDGALTGARIAGRGGSALVFVHGVGSTAPIWDPQLEAFAGDHRCASIELRGNGALPDPDPESITREGFADDVLAVADARGFDRFAVIGCSLGGVVAFELYKRVPERFDAMVIADSFAYYPNGQSYADGIAQLVREAGSMRVFAELRAAKLGLPPDRVRVTVEQMACKSVPCYLASTQATWTGDYRNALPTIVVPTLVLCGDRDTVTPRALSEEIARGIPEAKFEIVANAGHVSNADNPTAFNAVLRRFFSDVSG